MSTSYQLWVEGPTDAYLPRDHELHEADETATGALPAILVNAVRKYGYNLSLTPSVERLSDKLGELKAFNKGNTPKRFHQLAKKVLQALHLARRSDSTAIIGVFWDRDGREERLKARDQVHQQLRTTGTRGCFVGVPVEKLEAWLIADPAAFKRCFGRGPIELPGDPEELSDPKVELKRKLDEVIHQDVIESRTSIFARLANEIDIGTLIETCPRGFKALDEALQEFLVPCLSANDA